MHKSSFRLPRIWGAAWSLCLGMLVNALPVTARAELKVVATIKPIHSLVAQVMGTTGAPELLVGGNASPHTFVMKPSDAKKLATADIVFRVSDQVEPFTIKAAKLVAKTAPVVTLQLASGVVTLPRRAGGPFGAHGDHDHHDDHVKDANPVDGHVWLDPANAKAIVDAIAAALAAKAPEHGAAYKANAAAAKARIDSMTADLTRDLSGVAGRPYVVFHDAYQYFEKRFNLAAAGSITVNPDVPPSGKRLSGLRSKIAKLGATCVFSEPNFEAKVIKAVIEGSSAKTGILDPEGASLPPGPDLYDTLMRNLAASLKECLQPALR